MLPRMLILFIWNVSLQLFNIISSVYFAMVPWISAPAFSELCKMTLDKITYVECIGT